MRDRQGGAGHEIDLAQVGELAAVGLAVADVARDAVAVDLAAGVLDGPVREKRLATGDADGGVVLQRGDQASQPVGAHFRILVEQDEDGIALGCAQAAVAAGGKAEVGLVADQADVRVVALHEAGGAVVGRVVYDVGVEGHALLTLQRG